VRAHPGDSLITDRPARRGQVEEVRTAGGTPPYVVRWLDTDRSALVFPGPDAHVLTAAALDALDAAAVRRLSAVQREIRTGAGVSARDEGPCRTRPADAAPAPSGRSG
jgi:hypothetical protein